MRRIVIVGNAGSGKSTLARQLGERLRLPVVHLDALAWDPGWLSVSTEVLRSRLSHAISGDAWITDGNYAAVTFDLRLPRADLVIWVDRPRVQCLWRVLRRAVRSYFGPDEHLAPGCPERFEGMLLRRLRFILNFNRVNRPRIEAARLRYGPDVPVVVLRGGQAMSAFLANSARLGPPD
jgi:adenylate kinase family enzyme